ncbi:MAG: Uma2 family endonuclease [Gemmataceae bacterium]|nr:Uma2 family endonuclease [Gemmataceae bacterium]
MTMSIAVARATLADLARHDGKAELIDGRIVDLMATGHRPGEIAENIHASLRVHVRATRRGRTHADGVGFAIPPLPGSGRESFCPDTSYFEGQRPLNPMGFIQGAPAFAVEVRSENDYGPAAELELAAKRTDYFLASTIVVWDVDPVAEVVRCYRRGNPLPDVFVRGQIADAEPAVPGWRISVEDVFEEMP